MSLWHWDHRRAAWQRWLSAWFGPSAWQTFPVRCGEGSHTSVAIPVRGNDEKNVWTFISKVFLDMLYILCIHWKATMNKINKSGNDAQDRCVAEITSRMLHICIYPPDIRNVRVCSDKWGNHPLQCSWELCAMHQKWEPIKQSLFTPCLPISGGYELQFPTFCAWLDCGHTRTHTL